MPGRRKNNINFLVYTVIILAIASFATLATLSENGYLGFDFPRWSDFGTVFSKIDDVEESEVRVHFIDVGNADCTLIESPEGNILIDAGESDDKSTILQYLRKLDVGKLDYVFATHPHDDHIGSMAKVLESFEIGEFIMPEMPEALIPTTDVYQNLLQTISDKNINMQYAEAGRIINLGDLTLRLLTPLDEYDSINNMSIVIKLTYKSFSVMLTGDAEQTVEKDILETYDASELKADVLKVGHHGSATSSSEAFINAVDADYYYIPCGTGNSYGHPSTETMNTLKDAGGAIFRADYDGTVVFLSDGENVSVVNE